MNKHEAIKKVEQMGEYERFVNELIPKLSVLNILNQLDKPKMVKLKDVIARMKGLSEYTRSEWLDEILYKFDSDYGTLKYRDGYEQGKLEGLIEREKVKIPQFVADWIKYCKKHNFTLFGCLDPESGFESLVNETFEGDIRKCIRWCKKESNIFARAWLDGYEVEKEKRYRVKVKGMNRINGYLAYNKINGAWYFGISGNSKNHSTNHTRKELEQAGFGWVFDCEGIEIEEVVE